MLYTCLTSGHVFTQQQRSIFVDKTSFFRDLKYLDIFLLFLGLDIFYKIWNEQMTQIEYLIQDRSWKDRSNNLKKKTEQQEVRLSEKMERKFEGLMKVLKDMT